MTGPASILVDMLAPARTTGLAGWGGLAAMTVGAAVRKDFALGTGGFVGGTVGLVGVASAAASGADGSADCADGSAASPHHQCASEPAGHGRPA